VHEANPPNRNDRALHAPFSIGGETFSVECLLVTKRAGGAGVQASLVDSMQA
jgi:hypothetical protein